MSGLGDDSSICRLGGDGVGRSRWMVGSGYDCAGYDCAGYDCA